MFPCGFRFAFVEAPPIYFFRGFSFCFFSAHPGSTAVLVDELDTGCFHGPAQRV
jgi:hypothetical protein